MTTPLASEPVAVGTTRSSEGVLACVESLHDPQEGLAVLAAADAAGGLNMVVTRWN